LVLGILAATQGGKSYGVLPAAFITGTVVGLLVYFARGQWLVPYARDAVSFGLVVICVMVLLWRPIPLWATASVAAVSGSGYGYLLAIEVPFEGLYPFFIVMYTVGYATSFAALIGIGMVIAMVLKTRPEAPLYLRGATVVLLLVGIYFVLDAVSCRSNVFCRPFLDRQMFAMFGS
ncbi:MAG: HupE/UreJ family protein, partial [Chloroflexota bacterium]